MTGLFERKKRAKSAQLTVRLDEQLKKRAELRLEAMGMTATEAVEQLYRFIAEHGRMPLQIRIVTEDALPVSPDKRQHAVSGAAAEQALLDNTNFRVFYASGETPASGEIRAEVVQRFLTFLAERGVSCSDPQRLTECAGHVWGGCEEMIGNMPPVMQQAINDGVIFEASADTPDFSPELAAAFGFTQAQAEAMLKPALAARDLPGFLQRFLAFLADRGINCSNPRRFTEKVTEHASHEGLHRLIAMLMSRIRDEGVSFVFHNESPDELPRLAASLPGELADTFGFTGWQATTILRQIQPARPGQD
ncbi:type II toxin-antitoxin system RelB/DinJ family antitoxin [Escherichia coli]|uniref:type II toxin-antitoxin system RelB/DinJ family antitoxin n=1 Tax=Escherichia coli TaxID=562 RepID=UPI0024116801|nr:type II toxin-antitoxin system RelB/DinJ family antitoxin [Escherichia coli]